MTDTNTHAPPDGWVVCERYPVPGDVILLWRPAYTRFETSSWVPARVKDRRLQGLASWMVRPMLGCGPEVRVRSLPVHHYATPSGDPVTPTDTNRSAVHTPNNPNDPCLCGHSYRNHGEDNGRGVCFVCTHPGGGCRGFTPDRPDSSAAEYDAFLAGFAGGIGYGSSDDEQGLLRWEDAATLAYREWVEGGGEDA